MENSAAAKQSNFSKTAKKVLNNTAHYLKNPSNIIIIVFGLILSLMVLYPLITMIVQTFVMQTTLEARAINDTFQTSYRKGDWTVLQWPYLLFNPDPELANFSNTQFWTPLGRSVLMSLIACVIAIIGGGVLAFLITRTNMPFKQFVSTVFVFPYIMPSWSMAMFWVNFFKNSGVTAAAGVGMLEAITGWQTPQALVYGFWPVAIVMGLHYAPFAYILIGGILRNMDANLEEAATILKASRAKILLRITLPIVAPAMVSTILLVFASSISSYTVPAFLNADNSARLISLSMRAFFMSGQTGNGYIISTVLMVFSILILSLNNWFTRSRRNFTTVSGKSGQVTKINLGKAGKWIAAAVVIIVVGFLAIFPMITFILQSLEETMGDLSSITIKYWWDLEATTDMYITSRMSGAGILRNPDIMGSFGRSIIVAFVVAFIAGTVGILVGYAVSHSRRSRLATYLSSISFLPYLIPSLCFGAVYFSIMKQPAFSFLDATTTGKEISAMAMCFIMGSVKFLPFASRSGTNAMLQLSGEIEEAAIINGCPWWKRMVRIIFPIQKSSFISGYLLPFISCMREFTLFTLVITERTLATGILEYLNRNGANQIANGINLLIVVFVIVVNLVVNKVTGASIDKGIGG